jgi:hypothetical protein
VRFGEEFFFNSVFAPEEDVEEVALLVEYGKDGDFFFPKVDKKGISLAIAGEASGFDATVDNRDEDSFNVNSSFSREAGLACGYLH